MQIKVQDEIRKRSELAAVIEQSNRVLMKELKPSKVRDNVIAEWTLPEGKPNGNGLNFRLYDPNSSWEAYFSEKDLADQGRVESRILSLWIHLLQVLSEKSSEKIRQLIAEMDEGPEE